ncbi:hypothetical protein JG688_00017843 [Phytophthora aleatoria]|uniref:Uncharacterized protein n=1 Tax=Phytophthora aleatoria TaxID=2496075 RepID=A0A8J5I2Q7_9STRA|nr:hypothetical protein JG688_00017843 [Phytophthora aleatoria]
MHVLGQIFGLAVTHEGAVWPLPAREEREQEGRGVAQADVVRCLPLFMVDVTQNDSTSPTFTFKEILELRSVSNYYGPLPYRLLLWFTKAPYLFVTIEHSLVSWISNAGDFFMF